MLQRILPLAAAVLLLVPSLPEAVSGGALAAQQAAAAAAGTITAKDLHRRIGVLAHDSMRGRATPSPELDEVAAWIADEFRRMGLRPAGDDGGYVQRYPIRVLRTDMARSRVTSSTGATAAFGESVLPVSPAPIEADAEAPVALVTGTPDPVTLAGATLAGRHVVYIGAEPAAFTVIREAYRQGAASVIVATAADDARWERLAGRAGGASEVVGDLAAGPVLLQARDAAVGDLLGLAPGPLRERAGDVARVRELPGIALGVAQRVVVESDRSAPNVAAILPGSDPELRDEYVVFSAHMDHVGVGTPDQTGDSIYNGADDDASGTATIMEVAEAFASLPQAPRRSMMFVLVSGEERGLWGSEWFAAHPPVPTDAMVAALNADMVGRNWSDTIVAIGKEHSDLGRTLARVQAARPDLGMTAIDDLWPEENFYGRSDHFNFARRGVPILFFFNGTHADYHRPSDELDAIDAEKTARIGRLLFWLGLEIAGADARPRWDPDSYRAIVDGGSTAGG